MATLVVEGQFTRFEMTAVLRISTALENGVKQADLSGELAHVHAGDHLLKSLLA